MNLIYDILEELSTRKGNEVNENFGFWISDFGFWIESQYGGWIYERIPDEKKNPHILDFGLKVNMEAGANRGDEDS